MPRLRRLRILHGRGGLEQTLAPVCVPSPAVRRDSENVVEVKHRSFRRAERSQNTASRSWPRSAESTYCCYARFAFVSVKSGSAGRAYAGAVTARRRPAAAERSRWIAVGSVGIHNEAQNDDKAVVCRALTNVAAMRDESGESETPGPELPSLSQWVDSAASQTAARNWLEKKI